MNYRLTTILLAVALLIILGVSSIQAAPAPTVQPVAVQPVAPAGSYDFTNYGTAWVPEVLGQFSWWHARGWGMQAKSAAAGARWVHIPIPFPSVMASSSMYVTYVEFCAASNNGAGGTGPNHIDIYGGTSVLAHSDISWWTDNAYHCWGYSMAATWVESLGISLSLNYAAPANMITLYKAWVRVTP